MLAKSKTSATLLSSIAVLSFTAMSAIVNILVPFLITGDVHAILANPESMAQPENVLGSAAILAIIQLILIYIGAFMAYFPARKLVPIQPRTYIFPKSDHELPIYVTAHVRSPARRCDRSIPGRSA